MNYKHLRIVRFDPTTSSSAVVALSSLVGLPKSHEVSIFVEYHFLLQELVELENKFSLEIRKVLSDRIC